MKATIGETKISMWTDDVDNLEENRQLLQDLGFEIDIEVLDEVEE